jgi:hypothetical protein
VGPANNESIIIDQKMSKDNEIRSVIYNFVVHNKLVYRFTDTGERSLLPSGPTNSPEETAHITPSIFAMNVDRSMSLSADTPFKNPMTSGIPDPPLAGCPQRQCTIIIQS